ncbi:MAG: RNA polymerase sigma factor [Clostridia bacterium]|nr:RNA polymerase sigma factor [Clostridia bacterium]
MDNGAGSYRRFLDGDDEGLRSLIEEYRIPLQMFLNSITKNQTVAEDATVETFTKLAIKKPAYNGKASFKTWLFRIGHNAAVDIMRRNGNYSAAFEESDGFLCLPSAEEMYLKEERNRALAFSMQKLKGDYYSVLWLKYFENMQIKEIAAIMRKSEGSVKVLLTRARQTLKTQLEKDGFDYENK